MKHGPDYSVAGGITYIHMYIWAKGCTEQQRMYSFLDMSLVYEKVRT